MPKQKACPDCGGALQHLGEDVCERLEETLGKLSRKSDTALAVSLCAGTMGSADALLRRRSHRDRQ
jgi:transposase